MTRSAEVPDKELTDNILYEIFSDFVGKVLRATFEHFEGILKQLDGFLY